jgi:hypothetical protein
MSEISVYEIDVERYYLKCELGKVTREWTQTESTVRTFDQAIDDLDETDASRLAVALSCHYRMNPFCHRLGKHLDWRFREVPISQLLMSEINEKVRPSLVRCHYNLAKFVQLLKDSDTSDENLIEFRDDARKIWRSSVIAEQRNGMVQILDGSHRAAILALRGNSEISCYIGHVPKSNTKTEIWGVP